MRATLLALMVRETGEAGAAVPEAGETESQFPPEAVVAAAEKIREPPPELRTLTLALAALVPPSMKAKERFWVSRPSLGGLAWVTVKVTETVKEAGKALGTVAVTVPRYTPAAKPAGLTET